mmetsp:Transcript_10911/g.19720  ORF Transcript_10911/g.19720 Transcript_10911/m.19720 type:complete len:206 (-) Transcript_10911:319-936(-)
MVWIVYRILYWFLVWLDRFALSCNSQVCRNSSESPPSLPPIHQPLHIALTFDICLNFKLSDNTELIHTLSTLIQYLSTSTSSIDFTLYTPTSIPPQLLTEIHSLSSSPSLQIHTICGRHGRESLIQSTLSSPFPTTHHSISSANAPQILLSFSDSNSVLGFPPHQLSLTHLFFFPSHYILDSDLSLHSLHNSLLRHFSSQHRYGT